MSGLVALAGTARAGKDTLAAPLIQRGFKPFAFSHPIKSFFAAYLAGDESIPQLHTRMREANPQLTYEQFADFFERVLLPFEHHDLMTDAFTENDHEKRIIRPILEHGGELIYDHIFQAYFAEVDAALERGDRIVNTRLVRLPEAQAWVERGGVIYVVHRKDWPAASDWEGKHLLALEESGLVTGHLMNDGSEADWKVFAEAFARGLQERKEVA
ncbi:hypothetical protein [Deinococcus sp. S9]|uniref:hypothetical protein n=1 Tax=Deinococcus sp. S9 TaxID=2545754 RepID=UPI001056185F|nr:hypothetical protein [Deinococcus sp. S9]TDE87372.1 hypothetical protein E0686_02445 [Deinococcus sp. S9]